MGWSWPLNGWPWVLNIHKPHGKHPTAIAMQCSLVATGFTIFQLPFAEVPPVGGPNISMDSRGNPWHIRCPNSMWISSHSIDLLITWECTLTSLGMYPISDGSGLAGRPLHIIYNPYDFADVRYVWLFHFYTVSIYGIYGIYGSKLGYPDNYNRLNFVIIGVIPQQLIPQQ